MRIICLGSQSTSIHEIAHHKIGIKSHRPLKLRLKPCHLVLFGIIIFYLAHHFLKSFPKSVVLMFDLDRSFMILDVVLTYSLRLTVETVSKATCD